MICIVKNLITFVGLYDRTKDTKKKITRCEVRTRHYLSEMLRTIQQSGIGV